MGPATTEGDELLAPGACAACAWCARLLTPASDECHLHEGDCPAWQGLGALHATRALARVLDNFDLAELPPAGWAFLAAAADTLAAEGQLTMRNVEQAMFDDRGCWAG